MIASMGPRSFNRGGSGRLKSTKEIEMNATKIVNRFTGKVIAEGDCSARELAEQNKANLTGADLTDIRKCAAEQGSD